MIHAIRKQIWQLTYAQMQKKKKKKKNTMQTNLTVNYNKWENETTDSKESI